MDGGGVLLPFIPSVVEAPPARLVLSFMAALVPALADVAVPPTLTEVVLPMVALDEAVAAALAPVRDGTMVLARPVVSRIVANRLPKPSFGRDIIDVENSAKRKEQNALE